jgi:hypothetical protein
MDVPTTVHIALNPAYVVAIQDIRDEPGTLIVMAGGPTYRTEAILAPEPQRTPPPSSPEPARATPAEAKRASTTASSER